jgi:hypothetical protein
MIQSKLGNDIWTRVVKAFEIAPVKEARSMTARMLKVLRLSRRDEARWIALQAEVMTSLVRMGI